MYIWSYGKEWRSSIIYLYYLECTFWARQSLKVCGGWWHMVQRVHWVKKVENQCFKEISDLFLNKVQIFVILSNSIEDLRAKSVICRFIQDFIKGFLKLVISEFPFPSFQWDMLFVNEFFNWWYIFFFAFWNVKIPNNS